MHELVTQISQDPWRWTQFNEHEQAERDELGVQKIFMEKFFDCNVHVGQAICRELQKRGLEVMPLSYKSGQIEKIHIPLEQYQNHYGTIQTIFGNALSPHPKDVRFQVLVDECSTYHSYELPSATELNISFELWRQLYNYKIEEERTLAGGEDETFSERDIWDLQERLSSPPLPPPTPDE